MQGDDAAAWIRTPHGTGSAGHCAGAVHHVHISLGRLLSYDERPYEVGDVAL
ncbi:hypothetical protein ANCDUO_16274, partial [Ancylostoma duodenale]